VSAYTTSKIRQNSSDSLSLPHIGSFTNIAQAHLKSDGLVLLGPPAPIRTFLLHIRVPRYPSLTTAYRRSSVDRCILRHRFLEPPPPKNPPNIAEVEFDVAPADAFSGKMSVVYEPRSFIHDGGYPPMDDHHDPTPDADRFADPTDSVVGDLASVATFNAPAPPFVDTTEPGLDLSTASLPKEDSPTATTPTRIKAIPKPDREVTKNPEGKFVCIWPGCSEEIREFGRKCEWK